MVPTVPSEELWYGDSVTFCLCEDVGSLLSFIRQSQNFLALYDLVFASLVPVL